LFQGRSSRRFSHLALEAYPLCDGFKLLSVFVLTVIDRVDQFMGQRIQHFDRVSKLG
jgi:hypothetical protein